MTIAEARRSASAELEAAEVETPSLDARLLLAWVLKVRWEDLAREPERVLTAREQVIFDKAVALRALRRPLPYITGEQWFYGRSFKINRAVLIPRPETEMLVEMALAAMPPGSAPRLADIGTGSGCLAVTLAAERADAEVWATDISADALKTARKNAVRYGVTSRVTFGQGDLLFPIPAETQFDVIVSNPPYIPTAELRMLAPEVRDYEPVLALSGDGSAVGPRGTDLHQRLLQETPAFLKTRGRLLMEVGMGQAEEVAAFARQLNYQEVEVRADISGIGRVVSAIRPI
jgi:release factor glutamine methyltransferase